MIEKETQLKMDASHTINVQYLQSLDYDHEMAPASGKMTVDGKEYKTESVNDQVGLKDALVPKNTTNTTKKKKGKKDEKEASELKRNTSRDVEDKKEPSFLEIE